MKRILSLAALAVFAAGCATTGSGPATVAKPVSSLPGVSWSAPNHQNQSLPSAAEIASQAR